MGTETVVVNRHTDNFDIYIGRGTPWGNPYIAGVHGTLPQVIERYEEFMRRQISKGVILPNDLRELKGKRLGCSCKPKPCHGDVLVRLIDEFT